MTQVQKRVMIAYRPNDDVAEYLKQLELVNPDISLNQRVDALVRYAMQSLKAKEVIMELNTTIREISNENN